MADKPEQKEPQGTPGSPAFATTAQETERVNDALATQKEREAEQEARATEIREVAQRDRRELTTAEEAEIKALDETVPGGAYQVGDRLVDAWGKDLGAAPEAPRRRGR